MNDIFLFAPNINTANYADDKTPHATSKTIESLVNNLEENTNEIVIWFRNNYMKSNEDKNYLIITNCNEASATLGNHTIDCSSSVKLLGLHVSKI